ncbi:transposase [Streptomyces sp. P1-3]|uniref:transposase n=1 Tax=Streptomyces sp. P1-3 TaxID=3421658 RepID=UPI003D36DBA5
MARGGLTDEQWARLEPLLPPVPRMGRKPRNRRQVFDGIWWRARTGSPRRQRGTYPCHTPPRPSPAQRARACPPLAGHRAAHRPPARPPGVLHRCPATRPSTARTPGPGAGRLPPTRQRARLPLLPRATHRRRRTAADAVGHPRPHRPGAGGHGAMDRTGRGAAWAPHGLPGNPLRLGVPGHLPRPAGASAHRAHQ